MIHRTALVLSLVLLLLSRAAQADTNVVYHVRIVGPHDASLLQAWKDRLLHRLARTGTEAVQVTAEAPDTLVVTVAYNLITPNTAALIVKPVELTFRENVEGTWKTVLQGDIVTSAVLNDENGPPMIAIQLTPSMVKPFAELTARLSNRILGVFIDDQVVSTPIVMEAITGGKVTFSGGQRNECAYLAELLNVSAHHDVTLVIDHIDGAR